MQDNMETKIVAWDASPDLTIRWVVRMSKNKMEHFLVEVENDNTGIHRKSSFMSKEGAKRWAIRAFDIEMNEKDFLEDVFMLIEDSVA
jgi:hypothetical protein